MRDETGLFNLYMHTACSKLVLGTVSRARDETQGFIPEKHMLIHPTIILAFSHILLMPLFFLSHKRLISKYCQFYPLLYLKSDHMSCATSTSAT